MNLQMEINSLKHRIAELEEQVKEEQGFPKYYDDYWYVDNDTEVLGENWHNNEYDQGRLSIDNIFRTKEQAEFAVEKLKVEAELRKFGRRFVAQQSDCLISYEHGTGELEFRYSSFADVQGAIYFESKEKAQQAIESVGEERIKKYIFGVED